MPPKQWHLRTALNSEHLSMIPNTNTRELYDNNGAITMKKLVLAPQSYVWCTRSFLTFIIVLL